MLCLLATAPAPFAIGAQHVKIKLQGFVVFGKILYFVLGQDKALAALGHGELLAVGTGHYLELGGTGLGQALLKGGKDYFLVLGGHTVGQVSLEPLLFLLVGRYQIPLMIYRKTDESRTVLLGREVNIVGGKSY